MRQVSKTLSDFDTSETKIIIILLSTKKRSNSAADILIANDTMHRDIRAFFTTWQKQNLHHL